MTTPEFTIPIELELSKSNLGVLRAILQQTAGDAQNVGKILDEAAKLPGVSNTFRRNTVETQKATRAMQRDYQIMRVETARIEAPLRQTARSARSIETIARSTSVAIRTSARLHRDINGLLSGQQTLQQTINKLSRTGHKTEDDTADSLDRQTLGLETIKDLLNSNS